jgi:hypothetical protein
MTITTRARTAKRTSQPSHPSKPRRTSVTFTTLICDYALQQQDEQIREEEQTLLQHRQNVPKDQGQREESVHQKEHSLLATKEHEVDDPR